jgi:uncharacterized protein
MFLRREALTPTRIAIICILVYILYRLLVGPRKRRGDYVHRDPTGRHREPVDDVLVKDPVCKTYIPKKQALALLHDGKTYYFCSDACRKAFLAEKERDLN